VASYDGAATACSKENRFFFGVVGREHFGGVWYQARRRGKRGGLAKKGLQDERSAHGDSVFRAYSACLAIKVGEEIWALRVFVEAQEAGEWERPWRVENICVE